MVQAYNYRIEYSNNCHWIYLNEILFGTVDRGSGNTWYVNVGINGDNFLFTKLGVLKSSIYIQHVNSGESIGNISVPVFPIFFPKFKFIRKGGDKMVWVGKNFFSFHWLWKVNKNTIIETVEDVVQGNRSGVITLSSYLNESNLLILTGIFLSLRRKRRLSLGLLDIYGRYKSRDADSIHEL